MPRTLTEYVALLRGINVGGRNRVPMPELRAACEAWGFSDVRTYIQSGNIVLRSRAGRPRLEQELEQLLAERFELTIPVIARTAAEWSRYARSNPFAAEQPNLVMLALSKESPAADALAELRERASAGERVAAAGDAIWIHFANGSGRSKLSPGLLDRVVGSPVTTRNYRTVLELATWLG